MYIALLALLIIGGGVLTARGVANRRKGRIAGGVLIVLFTIGFFWTMGFWVDFLWFDTLGYGSRFWTAFLAQLAYAGAGILFGAFSLYFLTFIGRPRERRGIRAASVLLAGLIGLVWGVEQWETILMFQNRVSTAMQDPILERSIGFYLFTLPFLDALYQLLLLLSLVAFGGSLASLFARMGDEGVELRVPQIPEDTRAAPYQSLYVTAGILLLVLAWGKYLDRFHLMYSTAGVVTGAGWTDVNIRLPLYSVTALIFLVLGIALVAPPIRKKIQGLFQRRGLPFQRVHLFCFGTVGAVVLGSLIVLLAFIPGMFQWLRVEPNEITFEKPYIGHNIEYTRHGFGLHKIEEREFPVSERFTREMIDNNQNILSNIRLWDWRALDAVYKQFQEIRLYYEFEDVDIDRYTIDGAYRQVMVSARELELSNLPDQSQTFVNRRFKYTHGYGITLTTVSDFTPEGLPNLLIKDIPPKSAYPSLEIKQPQIYYGELTQSPVVANSEEAELDYPSGEKNVYVHYQGEGGVPLLNLWRKFMFGWKFDGTRFFLSDYPRKESRIMFHRKIQDRVKTLAPFLQLDKDPYTVLVDGKLYWIVDAYTTSAHYPYSEVISPEQTGPGGMPEERYQSIRELGNLNDINYVRNSVKVVVDAFEGSVQFYIFEPDDPLIQVWQNIFPELFKKMEEMPQELLNHVRYPSDMLLVQGLMYAKYHMTDPTVFYNQEDLWIRATEKYYDQVESVDPYYIMWELPGSDEPQFVLILPFTPKNRQVLIGWIAGMCDPENYGRFLAYKFPKEKRVLGTQQVETKIDQNPYLSEQLTLWDQRGSNVIRGNVLAIPIEDTLLYVEPIYLEAETAAYPELRLVAVMHNDNLSYAKSFDEALKGLFKKGEPKLEEGREAARPEPRTFDALVKEANKAFEDYLQFLGEKNFDAASRSLRTLQSTLEQLSNRSQPGGGTSGD